MSTPKKARQPVLPVPIIYTERPLNMDMQAGRGRLRDKRRNRGRVAAALRAATGRGELPQLGFGQYFMLADAICDAAAESADTDLDAFVEDCCGAGNGQGFQAFEETLQKKLGASPIIDIITQLLPVLLPLILNCFA